MRFYLALLGVLLGFCFGTATGFYMGFRYEGIRLAEENLRVRLANNIATYEALKVGDTKEAMYEQEVFLTASIKTYQYYKKQHPDFGAKDAPLQTLLEHANKIVPNAQTDSWQLSPLAPHQ